MTAGLYELPDFAKKLIRVRDVLDDLSYEHDIECVFEPEINDIARRKLNVSPLIFEPDVISKIASKVIPGDAITHFRKLQRKISLGRGDVENGGRWFGDAFHQVQRGAHSSRVRIDIAIVSHLTKNFLQIV